MSSRHYTWQPRCEGCGCWVPANRAPQDYRWCGTCEQGFSDLDSWRQSPMLSRIAAEGLGWRRPRVDA